MFIYSQTSGELRRDDVLIGKGYSGHGEGRNNPALDHLHDIGPTPRGEYTIGSPYTDPHKGPLCFRLFPKPGTDLHKRSGFLLHGNNALNDASRGCIIQDHGPRFRVANLLVLDNELTVVE